MSSVVQSKSVMTLRLCLLIGGVLKCDSPGGELGRARDRCGFVAAESEPIGRQSELNLGDRPPPLHGRQICVDDCVSTISGGSSSEEDLFSRDFRRASPFAIVATEPTGRSTRRFSILSSLVGLTRPYCELSCGKWLCSPISPIALSVKP